MNRQEKPSVDLSKVVSEHVVFQKAGLDLTNEGRENERISVDAAPCGVRVAHQWDEERDRTGSQLSGLREHRHVWKQYFVASDGFLLGTSEAATDWQPIQGRVELVDAGRYRV